MPKLNALTRFVEQARLQNLNHAIQTNRANSEHENIQRSGLMENKFKNLDDKILRSAITEEERMKAATLPLPLPDLISSPSP
jgi:hypothetical protein